ncbi:hypothetical protein PENSPDRAFT_650928, partial [Peniophora sp. CONT]
MNLLLSIYASTSLSSATASTCTPFLTNDSFSLLRFTSTLPSSKIRHTSGATYAHCSPHRQCLPPRDVEIHVVVFADQIDVNF